MNKNKKKGFVDVLNNIVSSHRNLYLYLVLIIGLIFWIQRCSNDNKEVEKNSIYEDFKKDE